MSSELYLDHTQPIADRVKDLIGRMTVEEKISQMVNDAPAIPRLKVPAYDWWNECLHGVGRAGIATVFPQAIGLASTWNTRLMNHIATAISDEARAKHHEALRSGDRSRYTGLTYWSPNINIFRDPRWGRGQETYGEDPYLTARMGVEFVKGLQGNDEHYLKLVATPKHFAVHSGPEDKRHEFDIQPTPYDLRATYLPAFKSCVQEANAYSIMGAYNRVYGEPCCASTTLLEKILRQEWGFRGFVVSDCGAIDDIFLHHRVAKSSAEAAALGVKGGCDLSCGDTYYALRKAIDQGMISETEIDKSLERLFTARFRLGMFDPSEIVPFASIPYEINDCPAHQELALQAARESIVLLKNNGLLPLHKNLNCIAVIGPNAADVDVLLGNYNGVPSHPVTILEGIQQAASSGTQVLYARGCEVLGGSRRRFASAVQKARRADVAILVLGLSQLIEGEEGQREGVAGGKWSFGDRKVLDLPGFQQELLEAIHATGVPVVLVLLNGSAITVNWAADNIPAILEAWYPGQAGGTAVAEVLFGEYNPAGRLPVTFYKSIDQLPPFEDYNMAGRTYRYIRGEPLYPFGYGLSYSRFDYSNLMVTPSTLHTGDSVTIRVEVSNVGGISGDEVAQLYLQCPEAPGTIKIWHLQGFERLHLDAGEKRIISFTLSGENLETIDVQGKSVLLSGTYRLMTGGYFPGQRIQADLPRTKNLSNVLVGSFVLEA